MKPMEPMEVPVRWWPEELGEQPHSAGGQNEMRYVHETEDHRICGVQQHESSSGNKVMFTSQKGKSIWRL